MSNEIKITGVKLIIERNDSGQWEDLTDWLSDEAVEAIETLLDNIEDAMNEDIQIQKCGGLH